MAEFVISLILLIVSSNAQSVTIFSEDNTGTTSSRWTTSGTGSVTWNVPSPNDPSTIGLKDNIALTLKSTDVSSYTDVEAQFNIYFGANQCSLAIESRENSGSWSPYWTATAISGTYAMPYTIRFGANVNTVQVRVTRGNVQGSGSSYVDDFIIVGIPISTSDPSNAPTNNPSKIPSNNPSQIPTNNPTIDPTLNPTIDPSMDPTIDPTFYPSTDPSPVPTGFTAIPTFPTSQPTIEPSTMNPSITVESATTAEPTGDPTTADGLADEDDIINVTTTQTPINIDAANSKSDETTLIIIIISIVLILVFTVFVCIIYFKRLKSREITKGEGMITNQIEMNKQNEQYEAENNVLTGNNDNVKNADDMDIINAVNETDIGNDNKDDIDNDIVKTINNTSIGDNNQNLNDLIANDDDIITTVNQTTSIGYNGDNVKYQLPPVIPPVVVTDFGRDNNDDLEEYSQESQHKDTLGGVTMNNGTINTDDDNTIMGEDDVNVGEQSNQCLNSYIQ